MQKSKIKNQNYNSKFKISFFLLFTICYLLFATPSRAASVNLGVYPPIFQTFTTPPSNISAPIDLYNLADETVEVKIILKPFTAASSENGEVSYLLESPTQSFIANNVKILDENKPVDSLTLSPKEIRKLSLNINVPQDQSRSDYYFSVIFISSTSDQNNSNISQSSGGIATNVLLSVGPQGPNMGEIKEFSSPFLLENGPVPFTLRIHNSSDHFIAPKGQILITNMFGQAIGKVDLLPVNILSNTTRAIPDSRSFTDSAKNPNLQFNPKIAFWNEKFLLGPYTASLTVSLSDAGPVFKRTIYFVGFPLYAFLAIIIVIFIVFVIRKRIKTRMI